MPVDIHPEEGIPGIELILTRLHAGGKFSGKNYTFSGGLHGVGVSVVNALSTRVEVFIRRNGNEYRMAFRDGFTDSALDIVGSVGKRNTGTRLRFRSEEHTSELQSLMRISYAVFCLKKKTINTK